MKLDGLAVCVTGLGVSGPPAARALAARGARVTVVDGRDDDERRSLAAELESQHIKIILGLGAETVPPGSELVVTSPGWRPDAPLLLAARSAGVPIIGDVELAWRLRPALPDGRRQVWLAVTGTNGKTTTVKMLAAMLAAYGQRTIAAGNVGTPLTAVVADPVPYPVLAVELSSFQLHWSATLRPFAAAVLNVAADHLDWHAGMDSYVRDKGRIFAAGTIAICNCDDAWSSRLACAAAGKKAIGFTLGVPRAGPHPLAPSPIAMGEGEIGSWVGLPRRE